MWEPGVEDCIRAYERGNERAERRWIKCEKVGRYLTHKQNVDTYLRTPKHEGPHFLQKMKPFTDLLFLDF